MVLLRLGPCMMMGTPPPPLAREKMGSEIRPKGHVVFRVTGWVRNVRTTCTLILNKKCHYISGRSGVGLFVTRDAFALLQQSLYSLHSGKTGPFFYRLGNFSERSIGRCGYMYVVMRGILCSQSTIFHRRRAKAYPV